MSSDQRSVYRFAGFELDPDARRLAGRHGEVALQPRPFELLHYLIEHRDRVVPRTELLREVWGSHVGPQALGYAIHAVRRALADDGAQQQVLRTVRGSGVQFVATLEVEPADSSADRPGRRRGVPPFLGREALLESAAESLAAAGAGRGGVLLLEGEAGIGKSRAIEQLGSMAERAGFRAFGGRCAVGEGDPAFSPWRQIVRAVAGARTVRDLAKELEVRTADLAWIAAPMEESFDLAEADPWRNKATRVRLFDLVAELIARTGRETPVFLSIDDIHRSDPASLALLAHLAPALCEARVWLVASFRKSDRVELTDLLASLEEEVAPSRLRHHELDGLDAAQIKTLVEALTDVELDPVLARALEQRTGGNPFFATLLINVLETQGRIADLAGPDLEALALPERVYDAVLLQLRDLKPETIEILELASTAGREFRCADLVGALEGMEEEELVRRLEPAVRAHVLDQDDLPGAYRFVHALVRESTLASMKPDRRVQLHARIAQSIEAQVKGSEWLRAAELAHHFLEATPLTGTDPALHYLETAADWASLNMGFEDAVEFLELGVKVTRADRSIAIAWQCRVTLKLGKARLRVGRRAEAKESFFVATRMAERAGLLSMQAEAALCFAPDFLSLETGVVDMDQVSLLEAALDHSDSLPDATCSQLLGRLAVALHWSNQADKRRERLLNECVDLAKRCGDAQSLAYASVASRVARFSVSQTEELTSVDVSRERDVDPLLPLMSRLLRLTGHWLQGRMAGVRSELHEFSDVAIQLGEPRVLWYIDLWRSSLALMEGRYNDAARFAQRFLSAGQRVKDVNATQSFVLQDFMAGIDCGGFQRYERPLQEMVERFPRVTGWRGGWALFLVECDRHAEARDLLDVLLEEEVLDAPKRNEWYALVGALAICANRVQHETCASKLYSLLKPHRGQLAVVGYGSFCFGSVHQLIGQCCMAFGELDVARTHMEQALEVNRLVGARPSMARVYADLARLAALHGDDAERRRFSRRASELAKAMQMYRLTKAIRELAQ